MQPQPVFPVKTRTVESGKERSELTIQANIVCLIAAAWLAAVPAQAGLEVTGLNEELESNVRALMPLNNAACNASERRIQRLYRDAGEGLRRALRAKGYYEPTWESSLEWGAECWVARFEVDPGAPIRIERFHARIGGSESAGQKIRAGVKARRPRAGDILDHGRYEAFKAALLNAAVNAGYFEAKYVEAEVLVDRSSNSAVGTLHLEPGPLYQFGSLTFSEGILRPSLLYGYTDIRSGEPYDAEAIDALYEALRDSGYFSAVSIRNEPLDAEAKTVPVDVVLEPGPRRVYSIGAGFATDTGPQGKLSFTNQRVNDRGHQLESRLFGSRVRTEWSAAYRWPRSDPRTEWYSVSGGYLHEDTDTAVSDTSKLGLLYTQGRSHGWKESRYLDVLYEEFTIGDQTDSSRLLMPGINWESVTGRELSRTRNGRRFDVDLRGASESLGSNASFIQLRASAKWVRSFTENTRVLVRARIGATWIDDFDRLPASVRFLAGGDQSVRGYDFDALGPTDDEGQVIGGENLFEASLELETLVKGPWAIAAFVDAGNAFNGTDFNARTGVGVGLRWYSPVGPIRLDLAHPLDDDRNWRIHITLGPDL